MRIFLKNNKLDLTEVDIKSSILHLAVPMMAGGFLINLFSVVDLFFVGKLGHIALAGLSVSAMILMLIVVGITGVTTGTVALIAHFVGKRDYDSANQVLWQTIFLSLLFWLILILVGIYGTEQLLSLFGAEGAVKEAAAPYLRINFIFSGFIFLHVSLNQAMRGAGDAATPLHVLILTNAVNIILDPLLIFGIGFFPRMEVAGSAVATVISRFIGLAAITLIMLRKRDGFNLSLKHFGINTLFINRIFKIGFFSSIQLLINNISLLFLTRLVASYGPEALAAYGVGTKIRMLLVVPGFGFASAAAVLMGQNMGAMKEKRAEESINMSLKMFEKLLIPAVIVLFIAAPHIIRIFNTNPEVISVGSNFLRYIMVTFPFLGVSLVMLRGLTGVGDTAIPSAIVAFFALAVRISLSYYLSLAAGMGTNGIWLGLNIADVLLCVSIYSYFKSQRWKKVYYLHRDYMEGVA